MGDTFTVSGHSYELGVHVYCLWPLLQIVSTHVLFVATTMNSLQCTPPIVLRVWLFLVLNNNSVCYKLYSFCYSLLQIGSTCVLFVATTVYSVCGHSYNSVYNNNVSVYCNNGSSSAGLHSDLYRFCYRHLYSQFIVVETNSTHVTHEVLARAVSEGVVLKEPEKIFKNVFLPPIKMVRWGVSSIQNGIPQIVSTILGVPWQLGVGVSGSSGVSPKTNNSD